MPKPKTISTPTEDEFTHRDEEEAIQLAARKGEVPLVSSPALDRLLLKNARKTPNTIAEITGIPADEIAERLTTLLEETTLRDDLMEEKLILAEVSMLVGDIRDRMSRVNVEDEGWASMARVQLAALKTLLEQVDKRRKAVDGKLALVNLEQVQMIGAAIRLATDRAALRLSKKYGIDEEEVYAEFEEQFPAALEYLESKADKP
jgi:DNA-binding Lrp family transcriptional regulator